MMGREERKRAKREAIERERREIRLRRKRDELEYALSLVHTDGGSYDADDRTDAVLVDERGIVLACKVSAPQSWERPGSRSLYPHLPDGHPRSGEIPSISQRALIRDQEWRPGNWGGAPSGVDPVLLGE